MSHCAYSVCFAELNGKVIFIFLQVFGAMTKSWTDWNVDVWRYYMKSQGIARVISNIQQKRSSRPFKPV